MLRRKVDPVKEHRVARRFREDLDGGLRSDAAGREGKETDDDFNRQAVKRRGGVVSEEALQ